MFVKLFTQILDSSIADDRRLRHFFTDLLLCADCKGFIIMTPSAIARRIGATLEEVQWGIEELQKPDHNSKTKNDQGRRIEPLGEAGYGWRIINYEMYRALKDADQMRETTRNRVARYRQKKENVTHGNACNADVTHGNDSQKQRAEADAEADAEAEAESEANQNSISKNNNDDGKKVHFSMPSLEEFTAYYGKAMEDVDLGEHLMLSDWLLEQHSYCSDKWAEQPVNNWKSQTGRFTRLYRTHWERTKPNADRQDDSNDYENEDVAF